MFHASNSPMPDSQNRSRASVAVSAGGAITSQASATVELSNAAWPKGSTNTRRR